MGNAIFIIIKVHLVSLELVEKLRKSDRLRKQSLIGIALVLQPLNLRQESLLQVILENLTHQIQKDTPVGRMRAILTQHNMFSMNTHSFK